MKKIISITLILSLILSMFGAINAFAATQGKCGDNLSWTFDGETVTISGIGNMYDYEFVGTTDRSPWSENTRVKYVVINDGVTSIGEGAFDSCDEIINVSIPNSVRTIGKHAFASCDNLTNLKLPNSLESIGKMAFALCHNIKSVTIPGSVIKIGDNAFGCSGLEEVVIMEGVQIIDTSAFTFCRYLENITFPSTITFIGANAFTHCEKLKNVTIPRKTNVADNAFDSNVVISYQDNTSIASQSKPIKVTLDGTYINFDVQPTEINGRVLVPVRAIFEALGAKVDWNESKNEVIATKGDVTIRLYKDNTTMYRNNNAITLDVPAKDIGDRILVPVRAISEAFGCKVDWSDTNSQVIITTKSEPQNEDNILKCGENLTYVRNGNTIEISGKGEMYRNFYAFNDTLENVIINEGVTNVSEAAFARCTKLKSVKLPSTLKYIGDNAFRGCLSLQNINLPENVSSIGEEAFWQCESLRSLTIPESVKAIGSDAFSFCTKLGEVEILGEIKIDKKDIFYGSDNVVIIGKNNSTTSSNSPLDENELRMHILSLGWSVYSDYPVPDYGDITGQRRNYTALSADLWYIYDNYFYPTSVDNDVKTYCKVLELCGFEFESERELSEYATTQSASITYRYKNTPLRVLIIREVWNRTASKEYTVRVYPFYGNY